MYLFFRRFLTPVKTSKNNLFFKISSHLQDDYGSLLGQGHQISEYLAEQGIFWFYSEHRIASSPVFFSDHDDEKYIQTHGPVTSGCLA